MAESRFDRLQMDRSRRRRARETRSNLFRNFSPRTESLELRITPTVDVWTGASSNLWSDAGNWTLGAPTTGQDLDFPASATNKTSVYDSGLGVSSFGTITIDGSGYDISESFSFPLTLTGGISTTYGSSISNFDIDFDPGNGTVIVGAGGTLEIGSQITGTSGLAVSGGGTLQLGGGSTNTYTGTTTVATATTLVLDKSGATAVPGALTISAGGTVQLAQSDQIADASAVTEGTGAILDLNNLDDIVGSLNLTGATVATGTGTLTLGGNVTTNSDSNTSVISGNLDLGGATRAFTVANNAQLDPDLSITANISGTGAGITKLGANSQLLLSGNNTYDGVTTISAGAIEISSNNALGASSAGTVVSNGFSLALLGNITVPEPITISGAGFGGLGAIFNGNGNNTISGAITLGAASTLGSLSGNLTFSGAISDGASSFALTKVCAGTVTLTHANTYDGGTTITNGLNGSGVLAISNGSALGTGSVSISNGNELDLSGDITLSRNISFQGAGVGGNGALRSVSGNNTYSGTATLQADGTRIKVDAGQLTLSGDLTDNSNNYASYKYGAGVLLVSGTLTSSGSLQSVEGDLQITGSYASSVTLRGGTISGTGTVGNLNQVGGSAGMVNPGTGGSTIGTFTTSGGYQVGTGGITHIDIGGTTAGSTYDQVVNSTSGSVDITGSNIDVSLVSGFVPAIGDVYTVIDKQNNGAITGTFSNLNEGDTFTSGVVIYQVSYVGGTGNDVTLTVVGLIETWTGLGGDNNWSTAANWAANTAPSGGENLIFPDGAARLSNNNDLSGKTFRSIAIGGGYDISGNAVTLTNGLSYTSASNASEIHLNVTLTATETVDVADGGDFIISGAISGSGFGVTKTGGGTLEYTGFSANTYTGTTIVSAGMLILNRASGLNAIAGDLIIGDNIGGGESVQVGSNNQIADASSVTVNEGATFDLSTSTETIDTLTLQGASVTIDTGGVLTVASGVTSNATTNHVTSTISGLGTLDLNGGGSFPFTIADDVSVPVDLRVSTAIQDGGVVKTGAGTLAFSGSNTYGGDTNVNAGILQLENSNALGGSVNVGVNSGGSMAFSGSNLTFANDFRVYFDAAGTASANALYVVSGTTTLTGRVLTFNANARYGAASNATLVINGATGIGLDNPNSPNNITIANGATGRTIIGDSNSSYPFGTNFLGNIDVLSGYLRLGNDYALGLAQNYTTTIESGATLELTGGITIPSNKTIAITGLPVSGSSKIMSLSGNNTILGNIGVTGANNWAFDVATGTTLTVAGVISGARDFDKNNTGTLILSGTNTNTGNVNVGDGTLIVNGSLASSNALFSDGIVGGSGTVPAMTISSIGTLAPGNSPGILHTGNLAFTDGGSTYSVELNGATVGTGYDQADVTGTVVLAGATLSVSLGYTPAVGTVFTIINNDGSDAVSGAFNGIPEGGTITIGFQSFTVSYIGGTGNDVTLTALARTYNWTGLGGDNNWSTAANWDSNTAPSGGENLVFPSGAARLSNNNDLTGKTFRSIEIDGGGYDINGNAVTLTNGISAEFSSDTSEFHPNVTLTTTETVDVADGGDFILSGAISGTGFGVTKTGGGTLEYTGFNANTYTGTTIVSGGTLILNRASGQNAIAGNLVIGDNIGGGESVQVGSNNQIADGSSVTVNEGALFDLSSSTETIAALTLQGASVTIGSGGILTPSSLTTNVTTNNVTSTISGAGFLDLGGNSTFAMAIADDPSVPVDLRISAPIQDGGLVKSGSGTLALSGSNTYGGNTSVSSGVLQVESGNALGSTGAGTTVSSGASVYFSGTGLNVAENFINVAGSGVGGNNLFQVVSGDATLTGAVDMTGSIQIGAADSSTLTLNGVIDDGSSTYYVEILNGSTGRTVLGGSNLFDGAVYADSGFIRATNANAFGDPTTSTTVSFGTGGSLELSGGITIPSTKSFLLASIPVANSSKVISVAGNNTIAGPISLINNNQSFDVAGGTTLTVAGAISGSVDFDKNNTGTLILSGTNTNTGNVNVGDGTLIVNGSLATSNSVFVDGVLGGSGTLPAVTLSSIGTLAPGNSPGILHTGNLAFSDSGSTYSVELNGVTVGTGYDQADVTGTVTLAGATLALSLGSTPAIGTTYTIINNDGSDPVVGTFNGLAEGSTITIGLATLTISYAGGSNSNDVVLTVTDVTYTWDGGGGDDNWSTAANWVGDVVPTSGSNLVFPSSAARLTNTNDFAANTNFNNITIAAAGYTIIGNAIDLDGNLLATLASGTSTLTTSIALQSTRTVQVANGGDLVLGGVISGGFGLTKTGAGTLESTGANTYTGATTVSAGQLDVDGDGNLGGGVITLDAGTTLAIAGATTIDNAVTLTGDATLSNSAAVTLSGLLSGASVLTKSGSGTLTVSNTGNSAAFGGGITLAAGTLSAASDSVLPAGTITLAPGTTLALTGATTIDNAVTLTGDATLSNSAAVTLSGLLSGASVLTKSGSGTLTVSNTGNSAAFGGGITLAAGTLSAASDSVLPAGTITLAPGTTLALTGATTIDNAVTLTGDATLSNSAAVTLSGLLSGASVLTKSGSGTLTVSNTGNSAAFGGGITLAAGTLSAASDSVLPAGTITLAPGTTLALTGATTIDNAVTLTGDATLSNSAAVTLSGLLSGSSVLTKSGAGVLTLANLGNKASFSGPMTVSTGTLAVSDGNDLGSGSLTFSGGFLSVTATTAIDNSIILNVVATAFNVSSGVTATLSGVISETGGSRALNKGSSGTLLLSGNNTYTGNTNLNGGTVSVASDANLGSGTIRFNQGGTLLVTGSGTIDNAVYFNVPGTFNITGTVTLSGVIDGTSNLLKSGVGTLTLTATETYTGSTTVSAGTLLVNGSIASSSGVQVASGATLGGSGTVPVLTALSGGTVAPGNSPGILHTGNLAFSDSGSTYSVELNGATVGTGYDQADVTGTVTLAGATLALSLGSTPAIGTTYTIINNDGSDPVSGMFNGLAEGSTITIGAVQITISYAGGSNNNDVVLTVTDVTYTWDGGGGDDNWSTAANWVGDVVPTSGSNLVFPSSAARLSNNNNLASGTNFHSITIAASDYDINGNAITLTNGISLTDASATAEVHLNIALTATETVDVVAGGDFIISGAISGSGFGITKTGGGTLEYTGFSANTYTGTTTVNAGTLILNRASGLNAIAGDLVIGDNIGGGESVQVGSNNQIADGSSVTVNEGATFDLDGASETIASLAMQGASVTIGSGEVLTVTTGLTTTVATSHAPSTIQGPGTLDLGNNATFAMSIARDSTNNGTINVDAEIGTVIQHGGIVKSGSGTLGLSGINTYAGDTTVNAGGIQVQSNAGLGAADEDVTSVASGASVYFKGSNLIVAENFIIAGLGFVSSGALTDVSGSATLTGTVVMTASSQVGAADGATLTIGGVISETGGSRVLSILQGVNSGRTVLSGTNTYSGGTTVTSGTLAITNPAALGTGTVTIGDGTATAGHLEIDLTGTNTVSNAFVFNVPSTTGLQVNSGNTTVNGTVTLSQFLEFNVTTGASIAFAGAIGDGGLTKGLTKDGAGTVIFRAANTYTGTTFLNEGLLQLNASGVSLMSSNVVVSGPGTAATIQELQGNQIADGATITLANAGATLDLNGFDDTIGSLSLTGSTVTTGAGTLTIASGGSITTIASSQTAHLSGHLAFGGPNNFFTIAQGTTQSGVDLSVSAVVSSGENIIKDGPGTMAFSGANTYSGGTNINSGVLAISTSTGAGTGVVNILGTGTLDLSGGITIVNTLNVDSSGIAIRNSGGTNTISGTFNLGVDATIDTAASSILAISSTVDDSGNIWSLTKTGAGTLGLDGANTYLGGTTVSAGILAISNSGSLGTGNVVDDAEIDISNNLLLNNNFTINSAGTAFVVNGLTTIQGSLTLDTDLLISTPGFANLYLNGVIASDGGGIVKSGTGTLGLGQANTYRGGTTINGGFLQVFNGQATGTLGAVTINTGSTFILSTATYTLPSGGLSLADSTTFLVPLASIDTLNGSITLAGNTTFSIATSGALTVTNAIGGSFGLTKTSGGALILMATSSYTGPTSVTGGLLEVEGDISSSSSVTIGASGSLAGTGSVGVVAGIGGVLAPGDALGTFHSGSVSLDNASSYATLIHGSTAGTGYSQLVSSGPINLGGSTLLTSLSNYVPLPGDVLTIIDNTGQAPIINSFSNLPEGTNFTLNGYTFRISYVGGTGNDVTLTNLGAPTTSLSSNSATTTYGDQLIFTALITSSQGTPTGLVSFYDGSPILANLIGTAMVNNQGIALYSTTSMSASGTPHSIIAVYAGAGLYLGSTSSSYSQTVNPATLTVTANNFSRIYGVANPTFTATYSGFKNGETAANLTTRPSLSTVATNTSPLGSYAINAGGAVDSNYSISYVNGTLSVNPVHEKLVTNDYDGDGKSDVSVYIPSLGAFGIRFSSGFPDQTIPFGTAGAGQSIAVSGDFDGDGKTDLAVYLPSVAMFAYRPSSGGPDVYIPFGTPGAGQSIPVPGDYFGTGKTDIAVYLPALGVFALRNPSGGPDTYVAFGSAGPGLSIPVPGDFDGDGKADLAVYLPASGDFAIMFSSGFPAQMIPFGIAGHGQSIPVSGDFDGDGKTDLSVYLPTYVNLAYRPSGGGADVYNFFGVAGQGETLPAPGDYTGSGHAQVAAYLPPQGFFAIRPGGVLADSVFPFAIAGTGQTIPVTVVDEALSQIGSNVHTSAILIPDFAPIANLIATPTLEIPKKKNAG